MVTTTLATTNWTQIEIVTISDIHLGNPANPAQYVIEGLDKLLTVKYLTGVNILFLAGDVFDRGLPLNHGDVVFIVGWIKRLLARCAQLGISVVVLEGTPSHDRYQSQLFVAINDSIEEQYRCNLRYITEVSIVHMEEYGIDVLFVPDEKNTNDSITLQQVKDLMYARAIEKVDFAVMHGFFDFQVPIGRNTRFHDFKEYQALVRYLIWIGHDHTFRQHENAFIQGSPDRQRHGMEEDKGFVRATIYRDGTYNATFEVNPYAMVFKTIELPDDVDDATDEVHRVCNLCHGRGHIRFSAHRLHPLMVAIDTFKVQYPLIRFTKKTLDEEQVVNEEILNVEYIPFTIDSSNIKTVIRDRLDITMNDTEQKYFDSLMESII